MEAYLSVDGLRAILVLFLAIGQAGMGYWPQFRNWQETVPTRSERLRSPVIPIEWAFAIWGLIFLSVMAFAVWQMLPANLDNPLLRRIGWIAVALFALNILWEYHVPRYTLDRVSVAIILVELVLLLVILFTIADRADTLSTVEFWLIYAPFQIFAGWISAAVFANSASALQHEGVRIGTALSAALITAAGLLGSAIAYLTGGWIYTAAVVWALFGLLVANAIREKNRAIAALSAGLMPVVLTAAALA